MRPRPPARIPSEAAASAAENPDPETVMTLLNLVAAAGLAPAWLLLCPSGATPAPADAPAPAGVAAMAAPAAPSNCTTALTAYPPGYGVWVGWLDNSVDETGFLILRSQRIAGTWSAPAVVAVVPANTVAYIDGPVPPGRYRYAVKARNGDGASPRSNWDTVVVP